MCIRPYSRYVHDNCNIIYRLLFLLDGEVPTSAAHGRDSQHLDSQARSHVSGQRSVDVNSLSLSCAMLCVVEEGGLESPSLHPILLPCSHSSSPHSPAMLSFLFTPFSCHALIPLHPILLPCSHPSSPHSPVMLSFLFTPFSCHALIPLHPILLPCSHPSSPHSPAMLSSLFTPFSCHALIPLHPILLSCSHSSSPHSPAMLSSLFTPFSCHALIPLHPILLPCSHSSSPHFPRHAPHCSNLSPTTTYRYHVSGASGANSRAGVVLSPQGQSLGGPEIH